MEEDKNLSDLQDKSAENIAQKVSPLQAENYPQAQEDTQQISYSSKRTPKLALISLVILILIFFSSILILNFLVKKTKKDKEVIPTIQPTSSPTPKPLSTDNWKTFVYENITFKYPPDWEDPISNPAPTGSIVSGGTLKFGAEIKKGQEYALIILSGVNFGKTSEEVENFFNMIANTGGKRRTINGYQAVVVPSSINLNEKTETITSFIAPSIGYDGVVIELIFLKGDEKAEPIFEQILSTFKFIDKVNPTQPVKYECPEGGWVDCMPVPGKQMDRCTKEAIKWYEENCPNFQGVAY